MENTATPTTTTAAPDASACADMFGKPEPQHRWLQKLLGEWTYEHECAPGPDQPAQKFTGTEKVRRVGDLWIVGESQGNSPDGSTANMILTLGYDPKRGRFVGTWIGSMMTHLWIYDGQLDDSGRVLTLNAEGPSFADPNKLVKYQDIVEIKSDDHRMLTSRTLGPDGNWVEFMTAHYRRTKR